MSLRSTPLFIVLSASVGCTITQDAGSGFETDTLEPTGGSSSATNASQGTSPGTSGSADASSSGPGTSSTAATDGSEGAIYDVGAGSTGGVVDCDPSDPDDPDCVCSAVDILFVIDSSGSMGDEQVSLGEAFPQFIDAIVEELPVGTNVHIGVTSTEMDPGGTMSIQIPCNGEKPEWYLTPVEMNTGVNGAQGRLFIVPDAPAYWEFETNAPAADLQAVKDWFVQAALVGTEGSSEEMSLAGAGWALDPVNEPTNAGFIRDAGAALVIFFVTDEDDQTPIAGGEAQGLIDTIAAAKADCGGLSCVAAGGTVRETCLDQDALGLFFAALDPAHVHTTHIEYNTMPGASVFVEELRDNLTQIIGGLCEEIQPEG